MTKYHFLFILFICILTGSCTSLSQRGMAQFESGEYQLAINTFSKILEKDPSDQQANHIVAESYRLSNRVEKATPYYDRLIEIDRSGETYYYKGLSLRDQGNYKEAIAAFEQAKQLSLNDTIQISSERQIANLKQIEQITPYWPNHTLENYELLNSRGIDYAPIVSENFLYFTSSRGGGGIYAATGQSYTKLFRARADGVKVDVQNVQALPEFRNEEGLNQGAIAISPDGNTIIYARGNSTSKRDNPEVSLYASYFRGAAFTEPVYMAVNGDVSYWNSTPAFSPDGSTLYFSSNRPGGYGGIDLYRATVMANGDFGDVQNLGPDINTPGNELFPRQEANGHLFFSSDGHPGFGKLDIFVAETDGNGFNIKNLGPNINSVADDFGIFFTNFPKDGFLASNREGGVGDDDIYYFEDRTPKPKVINVFLNVTTKERRDDGSEEILPQTRVTLYDVNNKMAGGDNTNTRGQTRFRLAPDEEFSIIASKSGYFTQSITYSTVGKTPDPTTLIQDVTNVTLDTTIVLEQLVLEKAIVLEDIYYDFDRAEIRPDAAEKLNALVKILKDNPNIRIELSSHTDSRGSDTYNQDLSQRRAESAVQYIISQGIAEDRLVARGYGESRPIAPNENPDGSDNPEGRQMNRRTEFKVIEITE
ncbi:OmpA family protein [Anditalea andensis]|uniref:Membrane protein n=1 Tax=Anditalea andensis TaxID=1048983 RepID=A0A074L0K6_9BACT|nr:OmpA family protein [Anditalea andensis]KEO73398.1 membrane protein [Anditalea andensis]